MTAGTTALYRDDWRWSGCSVGPDVVDLVAAEGGKTVSGVTCGAGDIAILAQDRRKGPP